MRGAFENLRQMLDHDRFLQHNPSERSLQCFYCRNDFRLIGYWEPE
ncbi:MAG: hypothetical protein KME54_11280 [Tolypothrix brevis GSE-NOS-MK-07-07A]|nr:hypothetical protein [Tolypothrix brevis GSE-NOS-MK-07-07A]